MGIYRTVMQKTSQGGYAGSPDQATGNSSSPLLNQNLTLKDGVVIAAVGTEAKKVISTAYQAVSGQLGSARLEEQTMAIQKGLTFGTLLAVSGSVTLTGIVAAAEVLQFGINNLVESHAIELENANIRAARGVSVTFTGGYYG